MALTGSVIVKMLIHCQYPVADPGCGGRGGGANCHKEGAKPLCEARSARHEVRGTKCEARSARHEVASGGGGGGVREGGVPRPDLERKLKSINA